MGNIARYSVFTDIAEGYDIIYISPVKTSVIAPYGCRTKEYFIGKFSREIVENLKKSFHEIICTF